MMLIFTNILHNCPNYFIHKLLKQFDHLKAYFVVASVFILLSSE